MYGDRKKMEKLKINYRKMWHSMTVIILAVIVIIILLYALSRPEIIVDIYSNDVKIASFDKIYIITYNKKLLDSDTYAKDTISHAIETIFNYSFKNVDRLEYSQYKDKNFAEIPDKVNALIVVSEFTKGLGGPAIGRHFELYWTYHKYIIITLYSAKEKRELAKIHFNGTTFRLNGIPRYLKNPEDQMFEALKKAINDNSRHLVVYGE